MFQKIKKITPKINNGPVVNKTNYLSPNTLIIPFDIPKCINN